MSKLMTFPRRSIKTSNFNKNITHNLLGIHIKMVIMQPATGMLTFDFRSTGVVSTVLRL